MIRIRAVDGHASAPPPACRGEILHVHEHVVVADKCEEMRSRRRLHRLADVVDQPLDQRRVVAFGHDPDQRLGARLADDQPAVALELGLGGGDALP